MGETIGVVGAGALGTLIAAKLAKAGNDVRVIVRSPERRDALRAQGHAFAVESEPELLRPVSLVFVCVKAYDTAEAARGIARLGASLPGVCSLQNGWDHMETLAGALPGAPLVAGASALGAYFDEGGLLHASLAGCTYFAPWSGTEERWADYACSLFQGAGFAAEVRAGPRAILWRKLALNAAVNPLTALLNRPNGALLEHPHLLRIAEAAALEGTRIGIRLGHLPPDYNPIPVLAGLLNETKGNRSSMAEDLARGRRTEADAILGSVLRAARETGEDAPVLQALFGLIRAAEALPVDSVA